MPYFMDRHDLADMTAEQVAAAHVRDLEVQGKHGVQFITYWFDAQRQHAFCLATGPDKEAVDAAHREAHGLVATQVIEVDEAAVLHFLGAFMQHAAGEPYVETAFRAILFTDLEGSTALTQKLGDADAMSVLRRHDEIVRSALAATGGTEVKHTGDGVMASFRSVAGAIEAAVLIQRELAVAEKNGLMPLGVRIGIAAGEPVTERDDLFGTAVQLASRLSSRAAARSILVTSAVRELATGKGFLFGAPRTVRLKGFDQPVSAAEVIWQQANSS
jgi:class 3 adenylate cyclase